MLSLLTFSPSYVDLQQGKVVILLQGRYAGKKAVIVKNYDDGTSGRAYGHALVCGLSKEPRKASPHAVNGTGIVRRESCQSHERGLLTPLVYSIMQVVKKTSQKKQARRSTVKSFIKVVNYQHMMPTRYTLDVDLKDVVTTDCVNNSTKRKEANKEAKALLEEKFKSGKNRWFFTKLRF